MKPFLAILIFWSFAAKAQDSLREFIPLLPKESKLTFSQWKSDLKQTWLRGSTKGNLAGEDVCEGLPAGDILISFNFYNLSDETGRANFASEKVYINDSYDRLKTDMQEAIASEKEGKQYSAFSNLNEESLGDGKAFYYERGFLCKSSSKQLRYVSYLAYLPVKPGFIEVSMNYIGSIEQVKAFAKQVLMNMKSFEAYNFFGH